MPSSRYFSLAEREGCYPILRRHGYHITPACHAECIHQLGRDISKEALREWRNELLRPKRSHHKKAPESEHTDSAPFDQNEQTYATQLQPDDQPPAELSPAERNKKLLRVLDRMLHSWDAGQNVDQRLVLQAIDKLTSETTRGEAMGPDQQRIWQRWAAYCKEAAKYGPTRSSESPPVDPWHELEMACAFGEDQLRIDELQARVDALKPGIEVTYNMLHMSPEEVVKRWGEWQAASAGWQPYEGPVYRGNGKG